MRQAKGSGRHNILKTKFFAVAPAAIHPPDMVVNPSDLR